ncbi:integrase core domain-containing protein [Nonomuraea sp. NPDC050404]|uniref:integrase core domain-containing protein n=1 Tax=Nonomuraea sp. NPDC050404 TaxID=3155783 RepID=UPI00340F4AD2
MHGDPPDEPCRRRTPAWFPAAEPACSPRPTTRAGPATAAWSIADAGLRVLKSPPQVPKTTAHCERMIGTLRRELLDRTLIRNEKHLRRTLTRYPEHCDSARPSRQARKAVQDVSRPKRPQGASWGYVGRPVGLLPGRSITGGCFRRSRRSAWRGQATRAGQSWRAG